MSELPITGNRLLSIWWALTWRMFVGGLIYTALNILAAKYVPLIYPLAKLVFLILLIGWNFVALGIALRTKYKTFRVVLLPLEPPASVVRTA
jgi:hypothetical protein